MNRKVEWEKFHPKVEFQIWLIYNCYSRLDKKWEKIMLSESTLLYHCLFGTQVLDGLYDK